MQVIGGIKGSIDIWELALLPSLMINSETWTEITEDDYELLEDIQRLFFRTILQVPISCPKSAFCWETGSLQMRYRVYEKKLNLGKYLQQMDKNSLAFKIYSEQKRLKLPGLIKECIEIAEELKIVNEFENYKINLKTFKKIVKKAIKIENEYSLRGKIEKSEKIKVYKDENFTMKDYFNDLTVDECRTKFR